MKTTGGGAIGQIEFIGACATMIYELFGDRKPSATTANLLYMTIYVHTLGFNISMPLDRDRAAFEKLKQFVTLPKNWMEKYYSESEKSMLADLSGAMESDTKEFGNGWAISQMELYDAKTLINSRKLLPVLKTFMLKYKNWLLTMPSISEGKNYLISNSPKIRKAMSDKLGAEWNDSAGETKKLYLRKEILNILNIR